MEPFDDRGLIHVHLIFILGKWLTQNNTFAFNFMRCECMKGKFSWLKELLSITKFTKDIKYLFIK